MYRRFKLSVYIGRMIKYYQLKVLGVLLHIPYRDSRLTKKERRGLALIDDSLRHEYDLVRWISGGRVARASAAGSLSAHYKMIKNFLLGKSLSALHSRGLSLRELAFHFDVSPSTVHRLIESYKEMRDSIELALSARSEFFHDVIKPLRARARRARAFRDDLIRACGYNQIEIPDDRVFDGEILALL